MLVWIEMRLSLGFSFLCCSGDESSEGRDEKDEAEDAGYKEFDIRMREGGPGREGEEKRRDLKERERVTEQTE